MPSPRVLAVKPAQENLNPYFVTAPEAGRRRGLLRCPRGGTPTGAAALGFHIMISKNENSSTG